MLTFRISYQKIITLSIILLIYINFNSVWANNFIPRGHYVIDLSQKLEWLTCPVGMVWNTKTCVGKPLKLKFDKMETVISQANSQLEGVWRLPKREELEKIVCKDCKKVKINSKIFPNTPADSFWTSEINSWQPRFMWTVIFFTVYTFGRFTGFIPNYERLVRDR